MASNVPKSSQQRQIALDIAQTIIERVDSNRLTQVPLLHLNELPAISGLYLAADDTGSILYIGKADDLSQRCKISTHHKLPVAIERGATVLKVAQVDAGLAWAVEQKVIAHYNPVLNESVSCWWTVRYSPDPEGGVMVDANNTIECRYIADRDEWKSWQQPSDKGNSRAQLRRMVDEWKAQKKILSDLSAIHPDINRALAIVLQSHELLSRATVTVAIAAQQPSPQAEVLSPATDFGFEFEESVEC